MNTLDRLQDIFREIFDDENLILTLETSPIDIDDWDSLAQINVIVSCESEFNIKMDIQDIASINNVGDLVNIIERLSGG